MFDLLMGGPIQCIFQAFMDPKWASLFFDT
jgi:hypothetical protein